MMKVMLMKVNEIREIMTNKKDDYEITIYYDEIAVRRYFNDYYIYYYIYTLSNKLVTLKKSVYKNAEQVLSKDYTFKNPELVTEIKNSNVENLLETPKQTYQLIQNIFNEIAPSFETYEKLLDGDA
mgnify:CR=1 FL=1